MVHFIPPSQRRLALLAAQADTAPVLIYGADGTGKGALANWIHQNGPRSTRPYILANKDTSISNQILKAQGGSFVIEEIGNYPLAEQKTLLQILKSKAAPHPEKEGISLLLNVRVIATTSQTLEGRAQTGMFNADLLKKLNVFRIEMPALKKRIEEFEDIVLGLLNEITHEIHKEHLREVSDEAWEKLRFYDWPGNIRELRNVLRIGILNAQGDRIEASDLPEFGPERIDFRATREQFEKIYITELLKTFNFQIEKTCQMTRMDKRTLLTKMNQYGITLKETSIR